MLGFELGFFGSDKKDVIEERLTNRTMDVAGDFRATYSTLLVHEDFAAYNAPLVKIWFPASFQL